MRPSDSAAQPDESGPEGVPSGRLAGRGWRLGAYRDVLAVGPFRRLFIGEGVSGLGDGCGFVAVAWLAVALATPGERPYAVGLALAAYSLPGALMGLVAAGRLAHVDARHLLIADAAIRLALLGCISVLHAAGALPLWAYIALLAGSSLLASLGRGSFVSVVAATIPDTERFAANSLMGSTEAVTLSLAGPALGGVLVATIGASLVIGIDAATFAALLWAAIRLPPTAARVKGRRSPAALPTLLRRPLVGWLLALTVVFYGLYGPVETALPIFVRADLHAGARLYGVLWAAFGAGALIGALLAGLRTIRRTEPFAVTVVAGWGLAVVLVGATSLPAVACLGMAMGGMIYAPYPAVTTTALQKILPASELAAGAAGWFAVLAVVTPAGTAIGGPLVAALGARVTLLGSGLATVALALLVTAASRRARASRLPGSQQTAKQ